MASFSNPHNGGRNLGQDTQDLIAQLGQSNPGLQTRGRQQRTRIGQDTALVSTLYNQSPMGGREINMLVTVERPEGLFYMIFIAPENEFRQMQPVYEQMLQSVRFSSFAAAKIRGEISSLMTASVLPGLCRVVEIRWQ